MTALETALRQICLDLTDAQASFALVGGLAVSARTEPRFTRDADIAVAVASDAEAARLIRSLHPRGYRIEALVEQEVVAEADAIELLPQLSIRVASTGHLIALKVLARNDVTRPQDLSDLRALLRIASPADVRRARTTLTLISQRRYHRGRDLQSEMETLLRTQREQN